MTGVIVSVGITVDSYIVYFERLKDEARSGRSVRTSVDRSFRGAFRTVLAADLVSLAAAVVLYILAVGTVRGFAFFLGLSTLPTCSRRSSSPGPLSSSWDAVPASPRLASSGWRGAWPSKREPGMTTTESILEEERPLAKRPTRSCASTGRDVVRLRRPPPMVVRPVGS